MSFNIAGTQVPGCVVKAIETGKSKAQEVVQGMINEAINDPTKNLKQMQQPSGLSSFIDIKI
ncbi:hypothetical protein [Paenibacillus koleovorans]|uniref:hypothetical protein n=1 Tax=Paenibacillus koleovorans TaxID=121608 RepID=UPI000FDCADD2|nr:hypothetical protein [Paenibacillus koleovorans]